MSVNRFRPYVKVLPEDDANRQLVMGFLLEPSVVIGRQLQVLPPAGGWTSVRDEFQEVHRAELQQHPQGHLILLVDCDGRPDRLGELRDGIPPELGDRVFILGCLNEPERLKQGRTYDNLGRLLAHDCHNQATPGLWQETELIHNAAEIARMGRIRNLLFGS